MSGVKNAKDEDKLRKKLKKLFPEIQKPQHTEEPRKTFAKYQSMNNASSKVRNQNKKHNLYGKSKTKKIFNKNDAKKSTVSKEEMPTKSSGKLKTSASLKQSQKASDNKIQESKKNKNKPMKRRIIANEEEIPSKISKKNSTNKLKTTQNGKNSHTNKNKGKVIKSSCVYESSSDEDYVVNLEEELKSCIIDDYLEKQMLDDHDNEFYYEEEMEEEEEDEESFDSYSEYSDDDDFSYSYTDDETYEPENSFESKISHAEDDLIIHEGTATKRPLKETDGVVHFDSDHEGTQIIELSSVNNVKVIKQYTECERDVLLKLSTIESDFRKILNVNEDTNKELDCPLLVSEQKEDMDDYAEYSDCSSIEAEDLTAKYYYPCALDAKCYRKPKLQAHIIKSIGNIEQNMPAENNDNFKEVDFINTTNFQEKDAHILTVNVFEEEPLANFEAKKTMSFLEKPQEECHMSTRLFKVFNSSYLLAVLKNPIYLYGTLRFRLIAGELEVYGFKAIINKEYEVFSPRGCISVCLKAISSEKNTVTNLTDLLLQHQLKFTTNTLNDIKSTYNPSLHALVLLRRNEERDSMIQQYKFHMNENVFPNLKMLQPKKHLQECEIFLNCHINAKSMQGLQMPEDWQKIELSKHSRLMLVGGKAVGKSTLLRILLNRYLSRNKGAAVLLIDLDIGQPELGAPQTVSCTLLTQPLLGPGFFLHKPADFAYLVGQVNATLCIHRYLRAVQLLVEKCQATDDYKTVPWLINTMGYNQGIGTEIIGKCCALIEPTDVVQIQSNKLINNFPISLEPHSLPAKLREIAIYADFDTSTPLVFNYRLHMLKSAVSRESRYQREWYMSAKDLRYANLIAQLSDVLLQNSIPWCARLSSIKIISLSDPQKSTRELSAALALNVVFLCKEVETNTEIPMQCFGIGVVRSVDDEHIYIMPAIKHNMQQVNCLVLSEQPLPTANLKRQATGLKNTFIPFLYTCEGNASTAIKQIYHRPAHFLTGKHRQLIA